MRRELRAPLVPTRAEPGCITSDLHESVDDPDLLLVHESWVSEEDPVIRFEMPSIRAWVELAGDLLAGPMELTRWRAAT